MSEQTAANGQTPETEGRQQLRLRWDDAKMQTAYANAVNATSTREEVSLFFGTNQTWNMSEGGEVVVQLSDRIVLNPYAAKRLSVLLTNIVEEYERRFGALPLGR